MIRKKRCDVEEDMNRIITKEEIIKGLGLQQFKVYDLFKKDPETGWFPLTLTFKEWYPRELERSKRSEREVGLGKVIAIEVYDASCEDRYFRSKKELGVENESLKKSYVESLKERAIYVRGWHEGGSHRNLFECFEKKEFIPVSTSKYPQVPLKARAIGGCQAGIENLGTDDMVFDFSGESTSYGRINPTLFEEEIAPLIKTLLKSEGLPDKISTKNLGKGMYDDWE